MAKQHSSWYFCSPLLLTPTQTYRLDHHIAVYIARKQWKACCRSGVHLICSCPAKVATRSADRKSHAKAIFIKIPLSTTFGHFKANLATRSSFRRIPWQENTENLAAVHVFTLFASCPANVATKSAHRKSHAKATFIMILLLTTFAHFKANVATRSLYRRLHGKKTVKIFLLFTCSPYFVMSCKRRD